MNELENTSRIIIATSKFPDVCNEQISMLIKRWLNDARKAYKNIQETSYNQSDLVVRMKEWEKQFGLHKGFFSI